MKITFEGNVCIIEGLTADAVGADKKGAAAAARLDAIQYTAQQIERVSQVTGVNAGQVSDIIEALRDQPWGLAGLGSDGKLWEKHWPPLPSPQQIGAIPNSERGKNWGVAELGGDGRLWEGHRPPLPSPQQIGADPAGSAAAAQQNAIAVSQARAAELQAMINLLLPTSAFIPWGFGRVLAGSPFNSGALATNIFLNRYAIQSPSAVGDEVEITFLLKVGKYRLDIWGMRNNQQGVFQAFINDFQLGSDIDRYAATATMFVSTFNIEVFVTAAQKFRTKVIGKNPSSVGFQLWISAIAVYQI